MNQEQAALNSSAIKSLDNNITDINNLIANTLSNNNNNNNSNNNMNL